MQNSLYLEDGVNPLYEVDLELVCTMNEKMVAFKKKLL